jgi:hypothetical protein
MLTEGFIGAVFGLVYVGTAFVVADYVVVPLVRAAFGLQ